MSTAYTQLDEAVRIAERVTDGSIEGQVISTIRSGLDETAKARVLTMYDEGEISEKAARYLLGDVAFNDAMEKTRGAERMLSGDTSRFLTNE